MTTISIMPENLGNGESQYRAVAGDLRSSGKTPGEALDALTNQLDENVDGTLVIVQQMRPDHFFSKEQQARLTELMERWREARDNETTLPPEEQAELDDLVRAELDASAQRAQSIVGQLGP